jgi:haloacetate dehalogenase
MLFDDRFRTERIKTRDAEIFLRHAGEGPPLLMLHGYPQTHVIWHKVAPALASRYHVICADLRGYGDSSRPASTPDHASYSKRAMAQDAVDVMQALGYERFSVAGHDRGGRVAHRLALDHPERISHVSVMDIAPTLHMFEHTDQNFATGYYHWFFLIQPNGFPEKLIGADVDYYLDHKLDQWSGNLSALSPEAIAEYRRCFKDPEVIHASCEDYRAAASIDLEHDRASLDQKVTCPLLALWGNRGFVHRTYDVLAAWRERAEHVEGFAVDSGHYVPEEAPDQVIDALLEFLN